MAGPVRQVFDHTLRLVLEPREELGLLQRWLSFWSRLSIHCAGELRRDKAPQVAAALAYHTLFSLVPMLLLGFLVFQSVSGLEGSRERFETLVIDVLLPQPILETSAGSPSDLETRAEFNEARAFMRERFGALVSRIADLNLAGVGIVGLLTFLYGTTSLLGTVESSFDSIYRAEKKRPLRVRLPLYFTIMTLGPVALVGGQVLQDALLGRMASTRGTAWLAGVFATASPLLATWMVLFALFVSVPNTSVRRRCALTGSLVAALLWLVMQELFGLYVANTGTSSLYGALALVPILLLWVYLSWLVVLFGLEISYSLQYLTEAGPVREPEAPVEGDPAWMLPILARVGEGFERGTPTTAAAVREVCGLPLAVVMPFLARLEERRLLLRVDGPEGEAAWTLARPPKSISVREVLHAGEPRHQPAPVWDYLDHLAVDRDETVGDDTLESVLALSRDPAIEPPERAP